MRHTRLQNKKASFHRLALGIGLCLGFAGCSSDMSDLVAKVEEAKSQQKPKLEPLPEIKPHETFRYSAAHIRDPFEEIIISSAPAVEGGKSKGKGPRPVEGRAKEALEAFPLDSLRMVGVLEQAGVRWALISSVDGSIHRVTQGNYMGQNHGKILNILEGKIELMEIVPDGLGDWTERPASMALAENPKGR